MSENSNNSSGPSKYAVTAAWIGGIAGILIALIGIIFPDVWDAYKPDLFRKNQDTIITSPNADSRKEENHQKHKTPEWRPTKTPGTGSGSGTQQEGEDPDNPQSPEEVLPSSLANSDVIEINGVKWLAKNIDIDKGRWCYDSISSNCDYFGGLYTFEAAKKACKSLGGRLPSDKEWQDLANSAGGFYNGQKKKDVGDPETGFHNLTIELEGSFHAQPGGYRYYEGDFHALEERGVYWTATKAEGNKAIIFDFSWDSKKIFRYADDTSNAYSCRCVWDGELN